jgi:hypothetical protein
MTVRTVLHFEEGDVTDVSNVRPWDCWCGPSDYCKLCGVGPIGPSFEFSYNVVGGERHYVSEGCRDCTYALLKRDPFWQSRDEWIKCVRMGKNTYDHYLAYGLIDDFKLTAEERQQQQPLVAETDDDTHPRQSAWVS